MYFSFYLNDSYACSDEGFIEPPSKKAKASPSKPTPAASEASVPPTDPSAPSSLSKEKEILLAAAVSPALREEPVSTLILAFLDNGSLSSSPRVYI